jgi:hypothetical protein
MQPAKKISYINAGNKAHSFPQKVHRAIAELIFDRLFQRA